MDHLTAMQVFCRIAELGSYTAAADATDLSNATVTKYVQRLETRLGTTLLHRNTRRLCLTEAGQIYLAACKRVTNEIVDAETRIAGMDEAPRGKLRITASFGFGALHLAPMLPDFMMQYPDVAIDCVMADRFVDLYDEGFDLALRIAAALPDSTLVARRIANMQRVVCGAPDYFARHGTPRTPNDLSAHRCIIYTQSNAPQIWQFSGVDGELSVKVGEGYRADDTFAIRSALLAGRGVSMIPGFLVSDELKTGSIVSVFNQDCLPPLALFAVYPPSRYRSAKVAAFVEFLLKRFAGILPAAGRAVAPTAPRPHIVSKPQF